TMSAARGQRCAIGDRTVGGAQYARHVMMIHGTDRAALLGEVGAGLVCPIAHVARVSDVVSSWIRRVRRYRNQRSALFTSEQRGELRFAQSSPQHGQGLQARGGTNPLVHARAEDRLCPRFSTR